VRALPCDLSAWSSWAQQATVLSTRTGEGAALASVRLVGVCPASHSVARDDRSGRFFGLCSLDRRRAQPATVVAGTTFEGALLASVRMVGVGAASPCGGGHDR
jgi:hypothetical protein